MPYFCQLRLKLSYKIQTILSERSLGCKKALNFTCLTMKFHNHVQTNIQPVSMVETCGHAWMTLSSTATIVSSHFGSSFFTLWYWQKGPLHSIWKLKKRKNQLIVDSLGTQWIQKGPKCWYFWVSICITHFSWCIRVESNSKGRCWLAGSSKGNVRFQNFFFPWFSLHS